MIQMRNVFTSFKILDIKKILSFYKRLSKAKQSFEILRFDIRYSTVRCCKDSILRNFAI